MKKVIRITDPDGLMLELVGVDDAPEDNIWTTEDISADVAIRGFHSVAMWVDGYEKTAAILTDHLGFKLIGNHESRYRFSTGEKGHGMIVDIRCLPGIWRGARGAGTIHHVAFRVGDDDSEKAVRESLIAAGQNLTPVIDRSYFHSVYFRESSGILFELATDHPGFTIDESVETLGQTLKLPPQYQEHYNDIAAALPSLE